jgi:hypothetical protein
MVTLKGATSSRRSLLEGTFVELWLVLAFARLARGW